MFKLHVTTANTIFAEQESFWWHSGWSMRGSRGGEAPPIFGKMKTSFLLHTHNQGMRLMFLSVSSDLNAWRNTPDSVLVSL